MNLTNLFNFKYLIQNLKKSKALIILLVSLVPIFTSIMLLSVEGDYAISFAELSIVNIIFMYIIPIVLSMALFNYVYKKNSVDFIGSMPLSRKTIFLTNTIGGIGIIAIMQLITMISTLFLSKVLSGVIIFGSMVWDIFIFYTIAYIFVFTVSNLAMSFSGNKFSQLVVICLILFLIPFLTMSGDLLGDQYSYATIEDRLAGSSFGRTGDVIRINESYNFTAPSYIFDMIVNGTSYEYNTESVIKMSILSILYMVIGLIIFNKKRLEMAGESYENINIHLVVKMLTFTPFMFVFCSLSSSDRGALFLFFTAILVVYYLLFDLITNKKIKLKISIPAFIISALVVFAIYEGIIPQFGRDNAKIVYIEDIQSIYMNSINKRYNSSCKFDLLIEDKELINLMMSEAEDTLFNTDYYTYSRESASSVVVETYPSYIKEVDSQKDKSVYKSANAILTIKLKNGKIYKCTRYLSDKVYEAIITKLGNQKVFCSFEDGRPLLEAMHLTKEMQKDIIEIIEKKFANITYKELYEIYASDATEYSLRVVEYEDHRLVAHNFSVKAFNELYEKMITICNEYTVENLEEIYRFYISDSDVWYEIVKQKNPELFAVDNNESDIINGEYIETEEDKIKSEILYDLIHMYEDEIKAFIKTDIKNSVDINQSYIAIRSNYPTYYYTNNIDGFYNVLAKAFNKDSNYNIKLNEEI